MDAKTKRSIIKDLEKAGFGQLICERDGGLYIVAEGTVEINGKLVRGGNYWERTPEYDDFGTNKKIVKICDKYDCFCEWETPGAFAIREI